MDPIRRMRFPNERHDLLQKEDQGNLGRAGGSLSRIQNSVGDPMLIADDRDFRD